MAPQLKDCDHVPSKQPMDDIPAFIMGNPGTGTTDDSNSYDDGAHMKKGGSRDSVRSKINDDVDIDDLSITDGTANSTSNEASVHARSSNALGHRESRTISKIRILLWLMMFITTVVLSTMMYYATRQLQREKYEDHVELSAEALLETVRDNILQGVQAMDSLALSITEDAAMAASAGDATPEKFRSITNFDAHASAAAQLGKFETIGVATTVLTSERADWAAFIQEEAPEWLSNDSDALAEVSSTIFRLNEDGQKVPEDEDKDLYLPLGQQHPASPSTISWNVLSSSSSSFVADIEESLKSNSAIIGSKTATSSTFVWPLTTQTQQQRNTIGLLVSNIPWNAYFQTDHLTGADKGMRIAIHQACNGVDEVILTYEVTAVNGNDQIQFTDPEKKTRSTVTDYGELDHILSFRTLFDDMETFSGITNIDASYCPITVHVYPSSKVEDYFFTASPLLYAGLVVAMFALMATILSIYEYFIRRRQVLVLKTATKSHQIVSSLFPKNVRERLFGDDGHDQDNLDLISVAPPPMPESQKAKLKGYLIRSSSDDNKMAGKESSLMLPPVVASATNAAKSSSGKPSKSKPIADLFPNTTVLFADISGFTAWASTREPSQVFTLLEKVYGTFDQLADRRRVFKVETIGDCYVAVTGLPDPQQDHAVIMAKFASDILTRMSQVTSRLEVELGPETSDLSLRIGLHSGQVTAGVLRGQKSRFQLFGDTVNTASRIESLGRSNHIQCSQATADLLIVGGKQSWLKAREDKINAKGKGKIQTYWVYPKGVANAEPSVTAETTPTGSDASMYDDTVSKDSYDTSLSLSRPNERLTSFHPLARQNATQKPLTPTTQRLVDWNVDLLSKSLKSVVAGRVSMKNLKKSNFIPKNPLSASYMQKASGHGAKEASSRASTHLDLDNPRNEYTEAIELPRFDTAAIGAIDPDVVELKPVVQEQLRDYVVKIAQSYHENPFHNYGHASHVTMSANKILKRVVAADDLEVQKRDTTEKVAARLHDYTYGITSDPLTHFACMFSAMIHDVDHPGVPNGLLVDEKDEMAVLYNNKSVAEQNSVDLAWSLLMDTAYSELRRCLFRNQAEVRRFRQLLVNSVMATDIFDPELKDMRNKRWDKAFASQYNNGDEDMYSSDLKATVVIEHIIQAADVSHTMQHWHVYQKWNKRLFEEMYISYKAGRIKKDPAEGWYRGELWFMDNYVIPLAKKLKDCGVFGVSSDEFLDYAMQNRSEWERKGEAIVEQLAEEFGK